jgi:hypothetical protein
MAPDHHTYRLLTPQEPVHGLLRPIGRGAPLPDSLPAEGRAKREKPALKTMLAPLPDLLALRRAVIEGRKI